MAITITDTALAAALRVGGTDLETAEVARLKSYAVVHIARYMGDSFATTPDEAANEAVVRLCAYLYDSGPSAPNAIAVSGAGSVLFPWRAVAATTTGEAVAAATEAGMGTTGNPVVSVTIDTAPTPPQLVVTLQDGTVARHDLPDVAQASDARNRQIDRRIVSWARENNPSGTIPAGTLGDDTVTGRKIAAEAVGTGHIADGAVTGPKIPRDAIDQDHLAADSVGNPELRADAVGTAEVVADAIIEAKLSPAVRAKLNASGRSTYRGRWSGTTAYQRGDIVNLGAQFFIAVADHVANVNPPNTSPSRWDEITDEAGPFRGVVAAVTPSAVEQAVGGERGGDIVIGYNSSTVAVLRYATTPTPGWVVVASWARAGRTDTELEAFIERIVAAPYIVGSAEGIPGAKTFDGLFKSEAQTPIPAANVTVTFQVGNAADGDVVDETDAAATNFAITEEQAAESAAFLRCRYTLDRITLAGFAPRDIELVLQRSDGTKVAAHNIKDEGAGAAQFPIGDAGQYRWAVRVVTQGAYTGDVRITETEYHSAQPLADKPIEHIAEAAVSVEAEKRQAEDARLQADIARVEGIKAIVNGLPAATVTRKSSAIQWETGREPYKQKAADAFVVPTTGFVQFVLGNLGATPIMRAEDCVNRQMGGIYTFGTHSIGLDFDSSRRAILIARDGAQRSSLASDIVTTTVGYLMLHWAPARASGHATTELADLETRVEALEEEGGGAPTFTKLGTVTVATATATPEFSAATRTAFVNGWTAGTYHSFEIRTTEVSGSSPNQIRRHNDRRFSRSDETLLPAGTDAEVWQFVWSLSVTDREGSLELTASQLYLSRSVAFPVGAVVELWGIS